MEKSTIDCVKLCYKIHDIDCNQKYNDELPYSFHLKMVVQIAERFKYLIPIEDQPDVIVGAAGHDLIEDARLTYNDIRFLFSKKIAEIIYDCTEEKGKNRKERHSNKFYDGLRENKLARYVKLCDNIANVGYSRLTGNPMFNKYQKEFSTLKQCIYFQNDEYQPLWDELELQLS